MAASRAVRVLARKLVSLPLLTTTHNQRSRKHLMFSIRLLTTSDRCCCEKKSGENDKLPQQQQGNSEETVLEQGNRTPDSLDEEIKDEIDKIASAVPGQSEEIKTDLMGQLKESSKVTNKVPSGQTIYLTRTDNGYFKTGDKNTLKNMCTKFGAVKMMNFHFSGEERSKFVEVLYKTEAMAVKANATLTGAEYKKTTLNVSYDKPTDVTDIFKQSSPPDQKSKSYNHEPVFRSRGDEEPIQRDQRNKNQKNDRSSTVKRTLAPDLYASKRNPKSEKQWIDLFFHGEPLGLFKPEDVSNSREPDLYSSALGRKKNLWDEIDEENKRLKGQGYIQNGFQEMIELTKEGKLWQFPIDNEQGLEEKNVPFHEHVFLDHLIEDFPKKGPVRHFMHLVVVGLSKNPHLTVQQKQDHINWYRTYFKSKEDVLVEALGEAGKMGEPLLHVASEAQKSAESS